jgi:RNA methyltransferase, TrmH family
VRMDITSLQNPRVKQLVRLRERRERESEGLILVEGFYEIETALASGLVPYTLYIAPDLAGGNKIHAPATELITVTTPVFEKISYRDNPDGWLAVFPVPQHSLEEFKINGNPFVIVAEAIEKPGNLGAILRTADAAGVDAILVCDPRVDIYNPNVVRASRGTVFTVPVTQVTSEQALDWIRKNKINVLAATPSAVTVFSDVDLRRPVAIAVGTEDEGLSNFWLDSADQKVIIPMRGTVNSLNVSTSTAILAYEVVRQRRTESHK